MTEPMLEIRGLAKAWPEFRMGTLDLVLPRGCMMGLVGANGAGKSTLLKAILGLVMPDAGTLRFQGRDLAAEGAALRRRIAYVPDEPRFVPEQRLAEIAKDRARFYPDWDTPRWCALMEDFGLDPKARAGTLSMGMRTKFALSLALAREADLLVLDEPTTSLDPAFRRALMDRLAARVQDEGQSLIFSTHITSDLEQRADWVALLRGGQLIFCQDQEQLQEGWAVVKGGLDLLSTLAPGDFAGIRTSPWTIPSATTCPKSRRPGRGSRWGTVSATWGGFRTTRDRGLIGSTKAAGSAPGRSWTPAGRSPWPLLPGPALHTATPGTCFWGWPWSGSPGRDTENCCRRGSAGP